MEIEALMDSGMDKGLAIGTELGRAKRIDDSQARYIEFAKRTFPRNLRLEGLRIVIDCAHGAAYKVAPEVLVGIGRRHRAHWRYARWHQYQSVIAARPRRSDVCQGSRNAGRFRHRAGWRR